MEDFVTIELAKKLKEKGFKEKCMRYYDSRDEDRTYFYWNANTPMADANSVYYSWNENNGGYKGAWIDAPTIAQVLKWLREEKGLHIEVRFDSRGFGACIDKYDLKNLEHISFNPLLYHGFFKTYEEATLDGIEYVLYNLI